MQAIAIICSLFLYGCSDDSTNESIDCEYIYRLSSEQRLSHSPIKKRARPSYPWIESETKIFTISKEFFRCKGSSLNQPRPYEYLGKEAPPLSDCSGGERHSLPLRNNQEYIYPILLDLLNYIQNVSNKSVVITSGHRCATHNSYVDPSPKNAPSKHTIGAEVDFYVRGLEEKPEFIVQMLIDYYRKHPNYNLQKEYSEFTRFEKPTDVVTKPWYNKEVFIKVYRSHEGRNFDNRHPYPYITLQVRYDREKNLRVNYSYEDAQRIWTK